VHPQAGELEQLVFGQATPERLAEQLVDDHRRLAGGMAAGVHVLAA
jgi:hypothetical protein